MGNKNLDKPEKNSENSNRKELSKLFLISNYFKPQNIKTCEPKHSTHRSIKLRSNNELK